MRKPIIIICVVVLLFCLWLLLHKTAPIKSELSSVQTPSTNKQIIDYTAEQKNKIAPNLSKSANISSPMGTSRHPTLIELNQQLLADWQRPIDFYGKVVDENTNPVEEAQISFQWVETPYGSDGTRHSKTESASDGLFVLHGARGPSLDVWVNRNGYFSSHHGQWGFSYSHGDFSPDQQNPVIFLLRKKGQGVELTTSEHGIQLKVDVDVPRDNTPVRVDFFQKQASPTGELEISQFKPPFQTATNWSFSLSIPDGGLVENQDEFQFQAPETGYQSIITFDFTKGETNWTTQVTKQFYITFGEPKKYGWLRIESNLTQETVFLTYAINPTGSYNLEPMEIKSHDGSAPPPGMRAVIPEFK
jgi:hypothetical protein